MRNLKIMISPKFLGFMHLKPINLSQIWLLKLKKSAEKFSESQVKNDNYQQKIKIQLLMCCKMMQMRLFLALFCAWHGFGGDRTGTK